MLAPHHERVGKIFLCFYYERDGINKKRVFHHERGKSNLLMDVVFMCHHVLNKLTN